MKIGFLINDLSSGGAEHATCSLANYFADSGIDTTIVTVNNCTPFYKVNDNVKLKSLISDDIEKKAGIKRALSSLKKAFSMRKQIKDFDFDIVIGMSNVMTYYLVFSTVFTKTKCIGTERSNPYRHMNTPIHTLLRKTSAKLADGYIFQTEEQKSFFPEPFKNDSVIIPNAVFNEFAYDTVPVSKRTKIITTMGRLHIDKAHDILIRAFNKIHPSFPDYKLLIFGEGEEEDNLTNLIKELNAGEFIELKKSRDDAIKTVAESSAFVLTSRYEGMSNALLEAMFCGVPCVAVDNSQGTRDMIENYKNGIIVNIDDIEGIAKAISDILENPDFSEKLSENAFDSTRKYSMESIGSLWIDYFNKILKN